MIGSFLEESLDFYMECQRGRRRLERVLGEGTADELGNLKQENGTPRDSEERLDDEDIKW